MTGRVLVAVPRGYCAGVNRAIQTVDRALELYGPPVYVRKEIVHNKHVVTCPLVTKVHAEAKRSSPPRAT